MDNRENVRELALDVLLETEKNNIFVKDALNKQLFAKQFLPKTDRAFLSRLVEGVTEYQIKLDYIIDSYSKVKAKKMQTGNKNCTSYGHLSDAFYGRSAGSGSM
jgi:16S rRNA (cytosine967-C5)-methyltransferase